MIECDFLFGVKVEINVLRRILGEYFFEALLPYIVKKKVMEYIGYLKKR